MRITIIERNYLMTGFMADVDISGSLLDNNELVIKNNLGKMIYYISNNGVQKGALTFEQLKKQEIFRVLSIACPDV